MASDLLLLPLSLTLEAETITDLTPARMLQIKKRVTLLAEAL
jgi:hypothetical protein